jgi:1,4-alpha-glucan branching enzyme
VWIETNDSEQSCLAFLRLGSDPREIAVIVCNFTPVPREGYRIGVPWTGRYVERINTDATEYGGSGMGNWGEVQAELVPSHGHPQSVMLTLPPLSTTIFAYHWERN